MTGGSIRRRPWPRRPRTSRISRAFIAPHASSLDRLGMRKLSMRNLANLLTLSLSKGEETAIQSEHWLAITPVQPPGDLFQLLQAGIGDPDFPTFIPFVDDLNFQPQLVGNAGLQIGQIGVLGQFSTALGLGWRTPFGLANRHLPRHDFHGD